MSKCEHGHAITKFCMSEHCQSKEAGGCGDCFRKYHNHIGQAASLSEEDLKQIVRKFQIDQNYRPKSRSLQESLFNFFTNFKNLISANLDSVCKALINEIGYPYLQSSGVLSCYKKLKNKEYRKVTQKELRELHELSKSVSSQYLIKEEKRLYAESVIKMEATIAEVERSMKDLVDVMSSLNVKSNLLHYDKTAYLKITENFKQIKKYPDISFPSMSVPSQNSPSNYTHESPKREADPIRKLTRDVSLDKHIPMQSKKIKKLTQDSEITEKAHSPNAQRLMSRDQEIVNSKIKANGPKNDLMKSVETELPKTKRSPKLSFELKADEILLPKNAAEQNINDNKYSEKEEEINERKKKLMDLMNTKAPEVKISKRQTEVDFRTTSRPPPLERSSTFNPTLTPAKNQFDPETFLIKKEFSPSPSRNSSDNKQSLKKQKNETESKFSYLYKPRNPNSISKRSKTSEADHSQEKEKNEDSESSRNPKGRNETITSEETDADPLFHANIHIPIEQSKPEEEGEDYLQIKEESVHKYIVIPEISLDEQRGEIDQQSGSQSPLLRKRKEIQNFSAQMKLAESKYLEESQLDDSKVSKKDNEHFSKNSSKENSSESATVEEKSFMRINKILQESNFQAGKGTLLSEKEQESVEINDDEQNSIALLMHAIKKPGSEAIKLLQKALKYSPNNLSAAEYLSYLYLESSQPQECLKLCNETCKNISSPETNNLALTLNINKSAALNHLGRYSECITFIEKCLRHRNNDVLYKNLADAYYSIGILEKAIYNYEHAIIENPSNSEANYNLAVCHYQQQNYHNASIYIDKALKHQKNNDDYKEMLKHVEEKIFSNDQRHPRR